MEESNKDINSTNEDVKIESAIENTSENDSKLEKKNN